MKIFLHGHKNTGKQCLNTNTDCNVTIFTAFWFSIIALDGIHESTMNQCWVNSIGDEEKRENCVTRVQMTAGKLSNHAEIATEF